jgi:hypothetical protein
MHIILGEEAAARLRENYTVLELETFEYQGKQVPSYCVIDSEALPVLELSLLEQFKTLHSEFIKEYNKENYKFCVDAAEHLKGRFGGELDSFYEEILDRITKATT